LHGVLQAEPVIVLPEVQRARETGLMGLALHPHFARNHWLYLAYAYEAKRIKGNDRRRSSRQLAGRFVRVERFRVGPSDQSRRTVLLVPN
jgi:glucose/arabinose dehydrogenase